MSFQLIPKSMSLNGVITVTLRYFNEFGKTALQKTISCGGIYARVNCILQCVYNVVVKKVHVRYLISWCVSCTDSPQRCGQFVRQGLVCTHRTRRSKQIGRQITRTPVIVIIIIIMQFLTRHVSVGQVTKSQASYRSACSASHVTEIAKIANEYVLRSGITSGGALVSINEVYVEPGQYLDG